MGCFIEILKKLFLLALLVAFFWLGGWKLMKEQYNSYVNPKREVFVESQKSYGDFSAVSTNYQLSRCINLAGYKKVYAKYIPSGQKIYIYDTKADKKITEEDFNSKAIVEKIVFIPNVFKEAAGNIEGIQVTGRGKYKTQNGYVPFVLFSARVKNIPLKEVKGVLAAYTTTDAKTKKQSYKVIVTTADKAEFNPFVVSSFVNSLRF